MVEIFLYLMYTFIQTFVILLYNDDLYHSKTFYLDLFDVILFAPFITIASIVFLLWNTLVEFIYFIRYIIKR